MAFASEEDLCCAVCRDIFREPVVLTCSHSFCRDCVDTWWRAKHIRDCPLCKTTISHDPPLNLALRNMCDSFIKQRTSECVLHKEELQLFCVDHLQPLCVVCEAHRGHDIRPIQDAAEGFKKQLKKTLQPLKKSIKDLKKNRDQLSVAEAHIKDQARLTERQIQDQFKRLHQFLKEEEEACIRAVREEEEVKRRSVEDKMAAVSRDIEALSKTITDTEEQLRAADVSFLLQYKSTVERVQHCPLVEKTPLGPGALINQAKHVGNLGFQIWTKMKELCQFYPVILDPNSAASCLLLSEDLTNVRCGYGQTLPENPERFLGVLGSEGFISGIHSWVVEVSGNSEWSVGVVSESVQGRDSWEIYFENGDFSSISPPKITERLSINTKVERVQVKLDYERGTVCFSDADTHLHTNTHLHTFTHTFTGRLFPLFWTDNSVPLKILPASISVTVNNV